MVPEKLGKLLVDAHMITEEQFQKALLTQKKEGGNLGSVLVKLDFIEDKKLLSFLSNHYGIPYVDLTSLELDPTVVKMVPVELVQRYRVFPIKRSGSTLSVAMVDPNNIFAIDDIKFMTSYDVSPVLASDAGISSAINKYYDSADQLQNVLKTMEDKDDMEVALSEEEDESVNVSALKEAVEEAPVVKLANLILVEAIKKGASDIHIECYEKKFRVRYRLDGVMYEVMSPPMKLRAALTSRIKIMADLDIAERRLPQDGRIKLKLKDRAVDLRVSVLPCLFGEKIVLRILDKGNLSLELEKLGFAPKALEDFKTAVQAPYGMALVTGPTGSGKTTTLYSALHYLNDDEINIMTAEDPVEYNLQGVNQVQIREDIGLNFAAALRSFLRQDPDVILVGEIRDFETAEIAIKAALTGHLVLSTLHTNDAPSTINRLLNMGVEPFLVASSVLLILAQRLARRICQNCKEADKVDPQALMEVGFPQEEVGSVVCYKGKGCQTCSGTGYKGRLAIYEVMPISEEIRQMVLQGASADDIKKKAINEGMSTLRMSGLQKVRDGMTTVEEVINNTLKD